MDNVVIVSGARTAIGAFQGSLSSKSAPALGSVAIREAISRAGIDAAEISEVLMGNVLSGGLGQAPARQAALGADLPNSVPCTTVNKVCGSGMKTVMMAAQALRAGDASIVVAGGMESMSNAPYALEKARTGYRMGNGTLLDLMIHDGLWDPYNNCHMGNCGDSTASEFNISREELDAFSAESYRRASAAQAEGRFEREIAPILIPQRKGDPVQVNQDEEPGKGDPAKLPFLRAAFSKDGVTTAGNASSLNDGGCALVLMLESETYKRGLQPLARVIAQAQFAQAPERFTSAPTGAIQAVLGKAQLSVSDVDIFEVNEAFAVVAMLVAQQAGIPHEKLNVNGGAVALGHPIGMTGARLILTAAYELQAREARYAVCSPCIGGGEATAVLLERVS